MIEAYTTEEAIKSGGPLCNKCLKDQIAIGLPPPGTKVGCMDKGIWVGSHSFLQITTLS
jgi:hypothetical protein